MELEAGVPKYTHGIDIQENRVNGNCFFSPLINKDDQEP